MTDIVEWLRAGKSGYTTWTVTRMHQKAADEIERLRAERGQEKYDRLEWMRQHQIMDDRCAKAEAERDEAIARGNDWCDQAQKARAEIAMLRADLLKAEMKAELDDLEDVGRLVAIGRREGIEAALKIVQQWPPHMVVANLRVLLEEPGRD